MADSKAYKLIKADLHLKGGTGDEKLDIKGVISEFSWFESIDSPFVRLDMAILDSTDLDARLFGTEKLDIEFETFASQGDSKKSAKEGKIKATLQMYKIGSVIKSERAKMYILHFGAPEMYKNEANRAFGLFGAKNGKNDVVERMLKDHLGVSKKNIEIEPYTKMNVISPNWRPVDCISYLTDKVSRTKPGKGTKGKGGGNKQKGNIGKRQSGFVFYQNKNGYHFKSIDLLCEGGVIAEYKYGQKNVNDDDPVLNMFKIENIKYPDRANQLEKLRQGVYQTATFGVVMAAPTSSSLPVASATTGDSKPEGTVTGPVVNRLRGIFDKASTLEKGFPYDDNVTEEFETEFPTRTKLKILPKLTQQAPNSPDGGAEEESASILVAASYANQRWFLLNTHTLTITVPGNTAVYAGGVIKVVIPESIQKNKNKLGKDRQFSGKYLVKGVKHVYNQNGMTTELYLCRDSLPVSPQQKGK
jgi:hypothetical protein